MESADIRLRGKKNVPTDGRVWMRSLHLPKQTIHVGDLDRMSGGRIVDGEWEKQASRLAKKNQGPYLARNRCIYSLIPFVKGIIDDGNEVEMEEGRRKKEEGKREI